MMFTSREPKDLWSKLFRENIERALFIIWMNKEVEMKKINWEEEKEKGLEEKKLGYERVTRWKRMGFMKKRDGRSRVIIMEAENEGMRINNNTKRKKHKKVSKSH